MTVIACVDDSLGMMFGGRRVSRDSEVCKRITRLTCGKRLYISSYSKALFDGCDVIINDSPLSVADNNGFCFIEDIDIEPFTDKVECLILYFWNRRYPSDKKLDISFDRFIIESESDFAGSSHELITERVYKLK